jgi:hypothetical protein
MRAIAAIVLTLAATPAGADEISGVYYASFEVSAFEPCDATERWWLETTGEAGPAFWKKVKAVQRTPTAGGGPFLFLVVDADVSQKGSHGHLGAYQRLITVRSSSEIRWATADEVERCADSAEARALR